MVSSPGSRRGSSRLWQRRESIGPAAVMSSDSRRPYRTLSHTADTGIEVAGATLGDLFANAAYGMFDQVVDLSACTPEDEFTVRVEAADPAELLVDLLAELITVAEIRRVIPCGFEVHGATETSVEMQVAAAPADRVEHHGPPVKAVTYHDLLVERTGAGWRARVLFDI